MYELFIYILFDMFAFNAKRVGKLRIVPSNKWVYRHCILVVSSTVICWTSPLVILGVSGLVCCLYSIFDGKPVCKH